MKLIFRNAAKCLRKAEKEIESCREKLESVESTDDIQKIFS